jgi:probable F420-dependent oxidoreductase
MTVMRVGLIPALAGAVESSPDYIADYVRTAEASGFDSIWLGEHPALPVRPDTAYPGRDEGLEGPSSAPLPDPLDWLAFAAAHSEHLLLGTAVLILPLHQPVPLAKRVATLDQVSGGRVRLGVGVGWNRQEYEACNARWQGRGRRAEEMVEAMRVLWRDDEAEFSGEFVNFEPVYSSPKPVNGSVPIVVGASSTLGLERAGRLGDGFLPFERDIDQLSHNIGVVREAAQRAGRDPASIEITALGGTRPERIARLAQLGVARMLLFGADIGALPSLGERLRELVHDVTLPEEANR